MKKLISTIVAVLFATAIFAQPDVKVQAPNLVGINEQFNISFVVYGEDSPSDFSWSAGEDFQVVWGPQKGTSRSTTIVNGKRSDVTSTSYTYILLPKKAGKFELEAASFTVKGKKYASSKPNIEVVQDTSAGTQQAPDQPKAQQDIVSDEDIFMRLSVSKRSVMVGEPVTATLKIYQRVNIAGFENARFPSFDGFWSQELQAPSNIEFQRENIDDKIFNSAVLRSWTLIPQQTGELKIDPAELVCLINIRTQRPSTGSIFDTFFQDDYQTIRKRITTPQVSIKVSALPMPSPSSFGGGVGKFKMEAQLNKDSLLTHDAASLIVKITGTGNVSLLEAPEINLPPDFEKYDVKASDIPGGKQFEYPFIPRSHGDFVLGPLEYSYFDVAQSKYVTLKSAQMPIRVLKGNASTSTVQQISAPGVVQKDVKSIGSDIRFIVSALPALSPAGYFFVGTAAFWIILAVMVLLALVFYFVFQTMAQRRADVAGSKNRAASKMARKRLSQAGVYLDKNLHTAFYEELHKTILGFVSDKLNMDASEMSKENISQRLSENGVPAALVSEYVALLDSCEFARYAPDAGSEAMNADYEKAVEIISAIDGSMRRKQKSTSNAAMLSVAMLLLFGLGQQSYASDAQIDSLWAAGVNAYSESDWTGAAASWEAIAQAGLASEQLYYNIGNAYFKSNDMARAILNYERALKINPSFADASFNLEYANSLIQDKIEEVPEFFLLSWFDTLSRVFSSDLWAILGLVLFAITLAMVLLFLLGHSVASRKFGFSIAIVSLVLTLICFSFASSQKKQYMQQDEAIVMSPVCSVKSSPDSGSSRDLFVLHEGTKLKLIDELGAWANVELSDGRQGWVRTSDIELI